MSHRVGGGFPSQGVACLVHVCDTVGPGQEHQGLAETTSGLPWASQTPETPGIERGPPWACQCETSRGHSVCLSRTHRTR